MSLPEIKQELIRILGKENVLDAQEDLLCYSYDSTPLVDHLPDLVVKPGTTEEVQAVVRLANQHQIPVVPRGSGSNLSGGTVPIQGGIVLVTNRLNHILEIDHDNLTATVEAGVITGVFAAAVEAEGLFYPPDPGSMRISTLGGNIAENAGGPRAFKYGVTRDFVMGLEVVLPNGELLQTGNKCVKNVAGYDLTRLMVGSEGTLGIITKAMMKLLPLPKSKKTLLVYFNQIEEAARAVSQIVKEGIIPTTLELMDNVTIRCVEDYAHVGLPLDVDAVLLIEVDGDASSVEAQAESVRAVCNGCGARETYVAANDEEGYRLAEARRTALSALARSRPTTVLEDATVPRSHLPEMVAEVRRIAQKYDLRIGTFGHAGDGNLHPTILTDERDQEEMARVHQAVDEIFAAALKLGGSVTGEHGVGLAKSRFLKHQIGQSGVDVMLRIKQALDPGCLLNPGKQFEA
jgi:glycolate oxidase